MLSFLVQLAEGNRSFRNQSMNLISLILDFKALIFSVIVHTYSHAFSLFWCIYQYFMSFFRYYSRLCSECKNEKNKYASTLK